MSAPQTSEWVLIQIKPEGPFFRGAVSADLIRQELKAGKLSYTDMVYAAGRTLNWTRICDIEDFRETFPTLPDSAMLDKIKKDYYIAQSKGAQPVPSEVRIKTAAPPAPVAGAPPPNVMEIEEPSVGNRSAVWYFQFQGSEYGPVTRNQLQEVLEKGKAKGQLYVWRQGLKSWVMVSSIAEFAQLLSGQQPAPPPTPTPRPVDAPLPKSQANLRAHARHALVATVFLIIGSKWKRTIGICADISQTGFQLVMDSEAEFAIGQEYQFEIHPAETSGAPAFHAVGKAMWVKTSERRAGFAFTKMGQRDQETLKQCLSSGLIPAQ
jgi:hypothetical protein